MNTRSGRTNQYLPLLLSAVMFTTAPGISPYRVFAAGIESKAGAESVKPVEINPMDGPAANVLFHGENSFTGLSDSILSATDPNGLGAAQIESPISADTNDSAPPDSRGKEVPAEDPTKRPAANTRNAKDRSGLKVAESVVRAFGGEAESLKNPPSDKARILSGLFDRLWNRRSGRFGPSAASASDEPLEAGAFSSAAGLIEPKGSEDKTQEREVPEPRQEQAGQSENPNLLAFTPSQKAYLIGQALFLVSIAIYLASLPLLVHALTGDAAMTGVARMAHFWTFAATGLFAGEIVKRTPMKSVMALAACARGVLFGVIGVLGLLSVLCRTSLLPWPLFLVMVGVNAALVAHNHLVDMDSGGANKIFSTPQQKEKALYLYMTFYFAVMLVMPLLLGAPMDLLDARFGLGAGASVGFILFALMMQGVGWIYSRHVQVLGDPEESVVEGLKRAARNLSGVVAIAAGTPKRLWSAARIMVANKTLLAQAMMSASLLFVEDALFAVVLPFLALDLLSSGATGVTLLMAAGNLGGLIASKLVNPYFQKLQERPDIGAYRVIRFLAVGGMLAFVPSFVFWGHPSLWAAAPTILAIKILYTPISNRMTAMLQAEVQSDPQARSEEENIFSIVSILETLAMGLGGLAFSWVALHSGPGGALASLLGADAPMKVVTLALFGASLAMMLGLRLVKTATSRRC